MGHKGGPFSISSLDLGLPTSNPVNPQQFLNCAFITPEIDFKALGTTILIPAGYTGRLVNVFIGAFVTDTNTVAVSPTLRIGNAGDPVQLAAAQTPAGFLTSVQFGHFFLNPTTQVKACMDLSAGAVLVEITVVSTATTLKGKIFVAAAMILP